MGVHCIPSTPGGDAPVLQYFYREKQICHFYFSNSVYLLYVVWMRATFSTFMPVYCFVLQYIALSEDATLSLLFSVLMCINVESSKQDCISAL